MSPDLPLLALARRYLADPEVHTGMRPFEFTREASLAYDPLAKTVASVLIQSSVFEERGFSWTQSGVVHQTDSGPVCTWITPIKYLGVLFRLNLLQLQHLFGPNTREEDLNQTGQTPEFYPVLLARLNYRIEGSPQVQTTPISWLETDLSPLK